MKESKPTLLSSKTVIRTKNFEASLRFYRDLLELQVVEEYDDGNGSKGVILKFGDEPSNAFIEISEILPEHKYYQSAFDSDFSNDKADIQIKTYDVAYWAKKLEDHCPLRGPILRPWNSYYLYLRDPDGLQLIIYQEKVSL